MKLSKNGLNKCEETIKSNGRKLEQYLYDYLFHNDEPTKFLEELKKYQNEDGGFGQGLEPDALVPYSAALPTTFALDYLRLVVDNEQAKEMIKKALHYLENTFDRERNGWYAYDNRVNDYPHTPWWHYDEEEKMTAIDHHYGNPNAKIIAYFLRYSEYLKGFPTDQLVEDLINYIESKELFASEHECYCFIMLYHELDSQLKIRIEKKLKEAINQLIECDVLKYKDNYVPQPLDFITSSKSDKFGIEENNIENNLNYYVQELETNHKILPTWGDSFYDGEFESSYIRWIAVRTLNRLIILKEYQKIEE